MMKKYEEHPLQNADPGRVRLCLVNPDCTLLWSHKMIRQAGWETGIFMGIVPDI
jgi:hypothetical protein